MDSKVSQTRNPSTLTTDEQINSNHDDDHVYTRLGPDLLARLDPEDREISESFSTTTEQGGQ